MDNSRLRILVVDDESLFLDMIGKILFRSDYRPDLANGGVEAKKLLDANEYDVVLTDIMMPEVNGLAVLEYAKEKDPDTQVIMISAYGQTETVIEAMRLGASDFIQKPVDVPAIIPSIVEKTADKRLLLSQNKELVKSLRKRKEELEKALETIRKQQEHLVHTERLKVLGTMSAGMAHEINNPLAFISTNIQTLEKYLGKLDEILAIEDDGERQEKIDWLKKGVDNILTGVHKGVTRISQITMALRTFSRKDTGIKQEVNISACVDDAISLLAPLLKNVDVNINLESDFTVTINQQNMVQAIMNFIKNSCDAMENSNTRKLNISSKSEDGKNVFTVVDTGEGIPEEEKDKVLELFYTTKPVGKGSGMGLSIALGVVESSGGKMEIQSKLGAGTTVILTWPEREEAAK